MNNKSDSPFTPGAPVPVDFFVGRTNLIKKITRYVRQSVAGKQENVFLVGERGIGKSSLASFVRYYATSNFNILGVHVFLGRVKTLKEMVHHIFQQILKEAKQEKWFPEISRLFGQYITEVDLFGLTISFTPPEKELEKLVENFPQVLINILEKLKDKKTALFLALDDINGLAEQPDFANWYKSFVDEAAVSFKKFPVFIMLIGMPEKRDALSHHQPSLMRIFRIIEVEKLSDEEVKSFFHKTFEEQAGKKVEPEAMKMMVHYSSGLPLLMQEIGDSIYWIDQDDVITERDAQVGIVDAALNIGKKYLDPKVLRVIRSEHYRSILYKLGASFSRSFRKKDIETKLTEAERKVFHNFLRRIRQLGVIEPDTEHGRGSYRFVNEIYPVYFGLQSMVHRRNSEI